MFWEVDEEEQSALFFQKAKNNPIYFNHNAMLAHIIGTKMEK